MINWAHQVHPFEETMLVHGRPSVVQDTFHNGALPIYTVNMDCEQAVFDEGKIRVVDSEKQKSIRVPIHPNVGHQDVVKAFSDAGYTHVQIVHVNHRRVGGIGYKALKSHINCNICIVQATMEG